MGGGLQFFDIILFAILALFLIFRLGSVLGRRQDDQEHRPEQNDNAQHEDADGDNVVEMPNHAETTAADREAMDPLEAGLEDISAADPRFRDREFVKGARGAFEMIVEAFAGGNGKMLKSLLDGPVYENFASAIREREKAGHELETTLVGIEEAEIISAEMQGSDASVTVKFVTGQINVTRDVNGEVVDGDPDNAVQVTDIWTFGRDTRSSNPNWLLVATGTSN